jgi:hypothetical protein
LKDGRKVGRTKKRADGKKDAMATFGRTDRRKTCLKEDMLEGKDVKGKHTDAMRSRPPPFSPTSWALLKRTGISRKKGKGTEWKEKRDRKGKARKERIDREGNDRQTDRQTGKGRKGQERKRKGRNVKERERTGKKSKDRKGREESNGKDRKRKNRTGQRKGRTRKHRGS